MEDMIDFECSPDWLDYYHERGLTPRSSGRNYEVEKLAEVVAELLRRQERLEEMILELLEELRRGRSTSQHQKRNRRLEWLNER